MRFNIVLEFIKLFYELPEDTKFESDVILCILLKAQLFKIKTSQYIPMSVKIEYSKKSNSYIDIKEFEDYAKNIRPLSCDEIEQRILKGDMKIYDHIYKCCDHFRVSPYLIKKYPQVEWDYNIISHSDKLTIDFIRETIDKGWNWLEISLNSVIKFNDVIDNPDLPWDHAGLSCNSNITINIVKEHLDIKWDFELLMGNVGIKIEDIIENEYLFKHLDNYNHILTNKNLRFHHFPLIRSKLVNNDNVINKILSARINGLYELEWGPNLYNRYPKWIRREIMTFKLVIQAFDAAYDRFTCNEVQDLIIIFIADYKP